MRETIIIVKEINPLMDPYIHHSCEADMSIKRNIDQLMLIGVLPIGIQFVIDNYRGLLKYYIIIYLY